MNKLPRLCAFDLVRCVAIFLVLAHHFTNGNVSVVPKSWSFNGFSIGSLGVSMFFILSGAALRYSDEGKYSLGRFVRSRFFSIFPIFWVGFAGAHLVYYLHFWGGGSPFLGIPKWKLVFSLLACDGWLGFLGPNFCVIGEWFLGCIIIIYAFYPIIRRLVEKWPIAVLAVQLALVFVLADRSVLHIPPFTNPLFRCFEFSCGVAFSRWGLVASSPDDKKRPRRLLLSSIAFAVVGLFVSLVSRHPSSAITFATIFLIGIIGFVVVYLIGDAICSVRAQKAIEVLSRYSFAAFLCHHVIANMLLSFYLSHGHVDTCHTILWFVLYLLITACTSFVLYAIGSYFARGLKNSFQRLAAR